jgi:hypothetical protein
MGGRIIYGMDHHHLLRHFTIARYRYVFYLYLFWICELDGCVHPGYAEAGRIAYLSNKSAHYEKKNIHFIWDNP